MPTHHPSVPTDHRVGRDPERRPPRSREEPAQQGEPGSVPRLEPMPRLLAIAEEITKLLAICVRCGNPAVHTQRLVESEELIVVGAGGAYEARCRLHHEVPLPAGAA